MITHREPDSVQLAQFGRRLDEREEHAVLGRPEQLEDAAEGVVVV